MCGQDDPQASLHLMEEMILGKLGAVGRWKDRKHVKEKEDLMREERGSEASF